MAGIILNIPYSGLAVPPPVFKQLALSQDDLALEHWRLTDPHLLEIAKQTARGDEKFQARHLIYYPYSPLVADPLGLLACDLGQTTKPGPTILSVSTQGKPLPPWNKKDRELILGKSVTPYTDELKNSCLSLLANENLVIVITMRSYFFRPMPFEKNQRRPRPQLCLGFTEKLCPNGLAELMGSTFKAMGLWPELNWPLTGTFVNPDLSKHPRLKALGLYFRRDLYMDEKTGKIKSDLDSLVRVLRTILNLLEQELDRVAKLKIRRAFPPQRPSSIIKANHKPDDSN